MNTPKRVRPWPANVRPLRAAATLCVAAALLAGTGAAADGPSGRVLNTPPSPLVALLDDAGTLSPDARRTLATLLIDALVDAYRSELDAVRDAHAREDADSARLASWYRATLPMLEMLESERDALPDARQVRLQPERHGDVLLLVDRRPVWLSWPRPAARAGAERAIVAAFCAVHECPDDGETIVGYADPLTRDEVQGGWAVTQRQPPTWESDQGVHCAFTTLAGRADKEAACRALVVELHRLARALDRVRREGAPVSWPEVALVDAAGTAEEHRVAVNERGDHVLLPLPALAGEAVDWDEVRRWLAARDAGRAVVATIRRPTASD